MTRPVLGRLGPFVGGLNNGFGDSSAVADNELSECINFDLDIDGSLVLRPPLGELDSGIATLDQNIQFIGSYSSGQNYLLAQVHRSSSGTFDIYALNTSTLTWTLVRADLPSKVCVQYADLVFIIPSQTGKTGGYWNGTTFTADANIPPGTAAVAYKQRLWVCPGIATGLTGSAPHELRFTDPINPAAPTPLVWTATNKIAVNQGDGQKLIDFQIYNDNLLCFKNNSTYVFAFDVLPSDGAVKLVNDNIGATTYKCVASFENASYVFHVDEVYEIVNYTFTKINTKVKFSNDPFLITQMHMSIFNDKLVVRLRDNFYVYNLRTRTWSMWEFTQGDRTYLGPFFEETFNAGAGSTQSVNYFAGSVASNKLKYYVMSAPSPTDIFATETFSGRIKTKNYDFGQPSQFKRLTWWGADAFCTGDVLGTLTPVAQVSSYLWSSLHALTWGSLSTWGAPVVVDISVASDVDDFSTQSRKFLKFLKSVRFRQANFGLTIGPADYNTNSTPPRIYSLSAAVAIKELVTKQVN